MKSKKMARTARNRTVLLSGVVALLALGVGGQSRALAGGVPPLPTHFSGLLNDYTPTSDGNTGKAIGGSPYEMHGTWTLGLNARRSRATFSAAMSMETSEVANASSVFDPGSLAAHTHHISVTDGVVHDGPMDWQTLCPAKFKPAVAGGFALTGMAYVTGNGSNAPFGNPSPVTICILGGTDPRAPGTAYVEFANLTLTFGLPASSHFGSLPIHGVVTRCSGRWRWEDEDDQQSCTVVVDH
ncbi:MAG: hypothetical protein ABI767_11145 [Rhodanobacter sp.]